MTTKIYEKDHLCEVCEHDPLNQSTLELDDVYWTDNGFGVCKECYDAHSDKEIAELIALGNEQKFIASQKAKNREKTEYKRMHRPIQKKINEEWMSYSTHDSEFGALNMKDQLRENTVLEFTEYRIVKLPSDSWELWLFNPMEIFK